MYLSLQQPISNRWLPVPKLRTKHNCLINPLVRLVHNSQVPIDTRFLIEFLVYSAVKAGIYGTAATKNTSSSVGDPILGCEGLGRGVKCINLRECGQESFLGHQIGIAIGLVQTQELDRTVTRRFYLKRTTGSATSYNYIVIFGKFVALNTKYNLDLPISWSGRSGQWIENRKSQYSINSSSLAVPAILLNLNYL